MIAVFVFYNHGEGKLSQWSLSKEFKHCNVMVFDGWWYQATWAIDGIDIRPVKVTNAPRLMNALRACKTVVAYVVVQIIHPHLFTWSPFGVHSCNELSRYITAINVGMTLTPKHLYKKLLKYGKISNYEILAQWRRHGRPEEWKQSK